MSDLVGISSGAVQAYQRALGVVSNNIANVGTEGYTRQVSDLAATAPRRIGQAFLGTGVEFQAIRRSVDEFIQQNMRNSNSDLAAQSPLVDYANRVVDVIGSEETGLISALNQFFESTRALSVDPASPVLRQSMLSGADGVTGRLNELAQNFTALGEEVGTFMQTTADEINSLATQLVGLNKQLSSRDSEENQPARLLDQRDLLLQKLSSLTRIKVQGYPNGAVKVGLGSTLTKEILVDKETRQDLSIKQRAGANNWQATLDPYGNNEPVTALSSGELGGLLSFSQQVMEPAVKALNFLSLRLSDEANAIHTSGLDGEGYKGGPLFHVSDTENAASTIRVAISDPIRLAGSALFRVVEDTRNMSNVRANWQFDDQYIPSNDPVQWAAQVELDNDGVHTLTVPAAAGRLPVAELMMGATGASVTLTEFTPGQGLQVFTKDGVQLLGRPLTDEESYQYLDPALGFNQSALYSSNYLAPNADKLFKEQPAIYGAFAETPLVEQFDPSGISLGDAYLPAVVVGSTVGAGLTETVIPEGSLQLNGTNLAALVVPEGEELQASDVASWLNAAAVPGLVVTAVNEQKYTSDQIDLTLDLVLQGDSAAAPVTVMGGHTSLKGLVDAVNAVRESSRVAAHISADGDLVLTNNTGFEGNNFYVGPSDVNGASANATGEPAGMQYGSVSIATIPNGEERAQIALEIGTAGTADLLKRIGFPVSVTFPEVVPDDLIVFIDGAGETKITSAIRSTIEDPIALLRQQPIEVRVTDLGVYELVDMNTATVIATRTFDPHQYPVKISHHNLEISLSGVPAIGDRFRLDGNQDGTGDNTKFLELAALETAKVMPGNKTLTDAYIESVSSVGNIAAQAKITQEALEVIYQQAFDAREQTSGVSLDEEAADLIRYQQAYQASAKVLQTASDLFDAILSAG